MKKLVPAVALLLALTACSGGDDDTDSVGQASPTPSSATSCPTGEPSKDLKSKPTVAFPAGTAVPTETTFTDVVVGTGPEAKAGSQVAVKYLGVLFADCQEFDSSWSRGNDETLPFTIGSGVIPGFTIGTTGMKVGGRRQVLIPAKDGYGDSGTGPIPPGATLVFVIDLVSVA